MAGAPEGNTNSNKNNRLWADTIRRALIQSDGERIRALAEALINKASEGDVSALKEIGDRIDGKSAQALTLGGDQDNPIEMVIKWQQSEK